MVVESYWSNQNSRALVAVLTRISPVIFLQKKKIVNMEQFLNSDLHHAKRMFRRKFSYKNENKLTECSTIHSRELKLISSLFSPIQKLSKIKKIYILLTIEMKEEVHNSKAVTIYRDLCSLAGTPFKKKNYWTFIGHPPLTQYSEVFSNS